MGCGERLVVLGMLRLRHAVGEARLNDSLTVATRHVGLDDWLLVLRWRTADDQLAVSLGAQLGAPVLIRLLLLILLAFIFTV